MNHRFSLARRRHSLKNVVVLASILGLTVLGLTGLGLTALGCGAPPAVTTQSPECCPDTGEDWPQFRGLRRDGISSDTGLAESWHQGGPREVWRRSVGAGFSGVAVKGEALYATWSAEGQETLFRLSAANGEEVWRRPMGLHFEEEYGDGPRATPTVDDGDVVYAQSSRGQLYAVQGSNGEVLWQVDLYDRYGGGAGLGRGYSSSPVVQDGLLIVQAGEGPAVVALNRETGEQVWATAEGRASQSSPIVAQVHGQQQVISTLEVGILGIDLRDGSLLWSFPWATQYGLNIALPVKVGANRFLIAAGYDQGAALVEVVEKGGGFEAVPVWENRLFRTHINAAVAYQGHLYGFDNSVLKCIDAETGEECWKTRGYGKGSLIVADGKLVVLGEAGQLAILKASPEGPEELSMAKVLSGKCWTAPSLAAGRLYVRNHTEMAAFDLRGLGPAGIP